MAAHSCRPLCFIVSIYSQQFHKNGSVSEHNTTGCDEDFQWVQNCSEPPTQNENTDSQNKFNELYNTTTPDPGKPITYRNKAALRGNRKDRDNKSKSSGVYPRYHSPSRNYYTEDILRVNSGRSLCYNCSSSCQDIPDFRHKDPHRYGSNPGLDCHWLSQPLGCYPCHHRNISPYFCDQLYPTYRYVKVCTVGYWRCWWCDVGHFTQHTRK